MKDREPHEGDSFTVDKDHIEDLPPEMQDMARKIFASTNRTINRKVNNYIVESGIDYIMMSFEDLIGRTLVNNRVRNKEDLKKLISQTGTFARSVLNTIYSSNTITNFILAVRIIIRLSKIDFRTKSIPYEKILSELVLKSLAVVNFLDTEITFKIMSLFRYLNNNEEFKSLPIDWTFSIINLMPEGTEAPFLNDFEDRNVLLETLLKRVLNEKFRMENKSAIQALSYLSRNYTILKYLKDSWDVDAALDFFGDNIYRYGVFGYLMSFIDEQFRLDVNYKLIKKFSQTGQFQKYYKKIDPDENSALEKQLYQFFYLCVCFGKFDYFENLFYILAKILKEDYLYEDLLAFYIHFVPKKRGDKFIKKCFEPEGNLSEENQNLIKKMLLRIELEKQPE